MSEIQILSKLIGFKGPLAFYKNIKNSYITLEKSRKIKE